MSYREDQSRVITFPDRSVNSATLKKHFCERQEINIWLSVFSSCLLVELKLRIDTNCEQVYFVKEQRNVHVSRYQK